MPRTVNTIVLACIVAAVILLALTVPVSTGKYPIAVLQRDTGINGDLKNILNATLGFQGIYMINLKSRSDHRDAAALAGRLTGLQIEFVDAVTQVNPKAFPPGGMEEKLRMAEQGNWRSHMDVARMMIENHIMSALVLEDDADWDLRIKSQMQDFAKAARLLVQPLRNGSYLDPTFPRPKDFHYHTDLYVEDQYDIVPPTTSPYGDLDNWDMLWIGHCGCRFPAINDNGIPLGRVVISNDSTVPELQHIDMQFGSQELPREYQEHSRVVSRAAINTCTTGYALSYKGAQRLLYELAISKLDGTTDMAMRSFCDGSGRPGHVCLTIQPELIEQHRAAGRESATSDISEHEKTGIIQQAYTKNIRWSTKVNLERLASGREDYIDRYADGEPMPIPGYK